MVDAAGDGAGALDMGLVDDENAGAAFRGRHGRVQSGGAAADNGHVRFDAVRLPAQMHRHGSPFPLAAPKTE